MSASRLSKLADGYLGVLGNEPSYATAQENLVALTLRFVRRFYFAGILLLVLAAADRRVRIPMPGTADSLNVGVAAAIAFLLFVIILVLTVIQFRFVEKRVHYQ